MIIISPPLVLIRQTLMIVGVGLLNKLWPVSTWTLAFGLCRLIRLGTSDLGLLYTLRVLIAVTAGACDLANHHLGIWGGVIVLLREEFLKHVNRVLVNLLLHATRAPATATTLRHSYPIILVFC